MDVLKSVGEWFRYIIQTSFCDTPGSPTRALNTVPCTLPKPSNITYMHIKNIHKQQRTALP
jgi:hypothetical protein